MARLRGGECAPGMSPGPRLGISLQAGRSGGEGLPVEIPADPALANRIDKIREPMANKNSVRQFLASKFLCCAALSDKGPVGVRAPTGLTSVESKGRPTRSSEAVSSADKGQDPVCGRLLRRKSVAADRICVSTTLPQSGVQSGASGGGGVFHESVARTIACSQASSASPGRHILCVTRWMRGLAPGSSETLIEVNPWSSHVMPRS